MKQYYSSRNKKKGISLSKSLTKDDKERSSSYVRLLGKHKNLTIVEKR